MVLCAKVGKLSAAAPMSGIPSPSATAADPATANPAAGCTSVGTGPGHTATRDPDPAAPPLVAAGPPVVKSGAASDPDAGRGRGSCRGQGNRHGASAATDADSCATAAYGHRTTGASNTNSIAAPATRAPSPAAGSASPVPGHPAAADAASRIGLATAWEPGPAASVPFPSPGLPVGAPGTGPADFHPGCRGTHADEARCHGDHWLADHHGRSSHVAAPATRAPSPTAGSASPMSGHPAAADAASWIGLATAWEPGPAASVPLPASGFPVRAPGTGPADFHPGCRGTHAHHRHGLGDTDGRCGDAHCRGGHADSDGPNRDPGRSGAYEAAGRAKDRDGGEYDSRSDRHFTMFGHGKLLGKHFCKRQDDPHLGRRFQILCRRPGIIAGPPMGVIVGSASGQDTIANHGGCGPSVRSPRSSRATCADSACNRLGTIPSGVHSIAIDRSSSKSRRGRPVGFPLWVPGDARAPPLERRAPWELRRAPMVPAPSLDLVWRARNSRPWTGFLRPAPVPR